MQTKRFFIELKVGPHYKTLIVGPFSHRSDVETARDNLHSSTTFAELVDIIEDRIVEMDLPIKTYRVAVDVKKIYDIEVKATSIMEASAIANCTSSVKIEEEGRLDSVETEVIEIEEDF